MEWIDLSRESGTSSCQSQLDHTLQGNVVPRYTSTSKLHFTGYPKKQISKNIYWFICSTTSCGVSPSSWSNNMICTIEMELDEKYF